MLNRLKIAEDLSKIIHTLNTWIQYGSDSVGDSDFKEMLLLRMTK